MKKITNDFDLPDNNSQYCEQDVDMHMSNTKDDQNHVSFLTD